MAVMLFDISNHEPSRYAFCHVSWCFLII